MIKMNDEYLHEFQKEPHWIESYYAHFIDEKNKLFGFMDIDFLFNTMKTHFNLTVFANGEMYVYNNKIGHIEKPDLKSFTDKKLTYSIISPFEKFRLQIKDTAITSDLQISGQFPTYMFPMGFVNEKEIHTVGSNTELWKKYEQRCKISGSITLKKQNSKDVKKTISCFGHREHAYGNRLYNTIDSNSRIVIQFKDMSMTLEYTEINGLSISNGFITRKSGNIPIQKVGMELITVKKNNNIISTEFSYKDAQDDVDLLVSKKLYSIKLPLPKSINNKFIRIRMLSEFIIIGTNKRGIGIEEHLISREKLKKMD